MGELTNKKDLVKAAVVKKAVEKKTAAKKTAAKSAVKKAAAKAAGKKTAVKATVKAKAVKADTKKKAPKTEEAQVQPAVPAIGEGYEFIHDLDQYLYDQGVHYEIFRKLGAHPSMKDGRKGIHFAVWAPNAAAVHLIGEFNGWNEDNIALVRLDPSGIWEGFVEEAQVGQMYKYLIYTQNGTKLYKADPYANSAEKRPGTASVIADISTIKWTDGAWMKKQESFVQDTSAISIYECHIGSWMRHPHGENEDGFYNYRYFAHSITDYLKKMGYIPSMVPGAIR